MPGWNTISGWNKWLKGLKLKFTYSKSVNTNKTNDYGTSYNLYYLETRSGSGEHLYTPIEGADNSAFENTSFYLANSGKPVGSVQVILLDICLVP